MFRKTIIALATTAVVAVASMGAAQAHGAKFNGFGNSHHHGHHKSFVVKKKFGFGHCKFVKRKVFIRYNKFGHPIYKFRVVKVCF